MNHSGDPCSLANLSEVLCSHFHLCLKADFGKKQLIGSVTHSARFSSNKPSQFILDTRGLDVSKVVLINDSGKSIDVSFSLDITSEGPLGVPLCINFSSAYSQEIIVGDVGESFKIQVFYHTNPESVGIQWLEESQTDGKENPYLFTQFQAIHCRTAIPCQDSPSNKVTYSADIEVPKNLTALMSAIANGDHSSSDDAYHCFSFSQKVPIPTYLVALVIGNLASKQVGPRTNIWAEPMTLERAAYEFENTNKYLTECEDFLSPYEWGRYDLLCLPGSFPYGGMENPCLTFVTPTLLAGDQSLTTVVCHEIAHSWTGNLVTNSTWEHFWLNEGFTVFTERKIYAKLNREPDRHFDYILGNKDMTDSIKLFGEKHPFTALVPKLENIDPDEAFSSIPYEKGSQFLFHLEGKVGVKEFEDFFRNWIVSNRFKSVTTEDFQDFFKKTFGEEKFNEVDWQAWLYAPGFPPVDILSIVDDSMAVQARELATQWVQVDKSQKDAPADDSSYNKLSAMQKVYFLDQIMIQSPEGLAKETLEKLQEFYHFADVKNSEIRMSWLSLCLASSDQSCFAQTVQFVSEQGRMKFVRPLYRSLAKCGPEGFKLAQETFEKHKNYYHNIAAKMIQQDLAKIEQ